VAFFDFSGWRLLVTAIILVLLYLSFPTADAGSTAIWLVLAYALSYLLMPWVKKYFFTKTIAFDMAGVMLKGEWLTEDMEWMPGMRELVVKLNRDYKTALITNNNGLAQEPFNAKFGFPDLFDYVLPSGKVHHAKPSVGIFQHLLRVSGSSPNNTIFIDDKKEYLTGATQLGIHTIHFTSYEQLVKDLHAFGVKI